MSSAYLSDVTGSGSRAQLFATSEALQWGGIALGPVIGAILYRWTGMILLPLYGIATCRIIYLLLLVFVVPESLSRVRRHDERRRAQEAALDEADARLTEEEEWRKMGRSVTFMHTVRVIKTPLQALAPLAVVLPRRRDANREKQDRPLLAPRSSRWGRDWGLTCVALSFGLYMIVPVRDVPIEVVCHLHRREADRRFLGAGNRPFALRWGRTSDSRC